MANEPAVRGVTEIDLQVHPPPDVVLEVDITNPSLDKMKLYRAARVPEVWRCDGSRMQFFLLYEGEYELATHSHSFSPLTSGRMSEYLRMGRERGSAAMLQAVKGDL